MMSSPSSSPSPSSDSLSQAQARLNALLDEAVGPALPRKGEEAPARAEAATEASAVEMGEEERKQAMERREEQVALLHQLGASLAQLSEELDLWDLSVRRLGSGWGRFLRPRKYQRLNEGRFSVQPAPSDKEAPRIQFQGKGETWLLLGSDGRFYELRFPGGPGQWLDFDQQMAEASVTADASIDWSHWEEDLPKLTAQLRERVRATREERERHRQTLLAKLRLRHLQ